MSNWGRFCFGHFKNVQNKNINNTYKYNKNFRRYDMKEFTIKRVFIIFFAFIISFSVYIGQNSIRNEKREIGDAVQVTSLPVSGKVVILDAGHGTPDEGVSLLH